MNKLIVFIFDRNKDESILIDTKEICGLEDQINNQLEQLAEETNKNHRLAGQLEIQTQPA